MLNHLLKQSPEVRADFAALAGRRLRISLPPLAVTGVVCDDGYWAATEGEPETVVRLSTGAAFKRVAGGEMTPADVAVDGDSELGLAAARLLARLQWDAAEDASRLVGDVAAHRLERFVRGALGVKGEIGARLIGSYVEHLKEEVPLLARRPDVERFCGEVDDARDALERVEKRLARLEAARAVVRG